jgi:pectin methylesterase-like acyl-CoA thioesterase
MAISIRYLIWLFQYFSLLGESILRIGWILVLVIVTGSAESATITVGPSGCDYAIIQKAVNAASPDDIIEINNGTYYENVNVTKSLILHGKGRTRIDANAIA